MQNIVDDLKEMILRYRNSELTVDMASSFEQIQLQLEDICQDSPIRVGIVGEFSTGKSTFINALLESELLKEDILPGTTCAPTKLSYNPENPVLAVNIWWNDNTYDTYQIAPGESTGVTSSEQMRAAIDFIHEHTADESVAKKVFCVEISLPELKYFPNITFIDMPGINTGNLRHEEVAEYVICNFCDATIVLTPSTSPCSETLRSFLQRHPENFQRHNSICLVTQIDKVREQERERVVKFVEDRFAENNISFNGVYPIASTAVLHPEDIRNDSDQRRLQKDFYRTTGAVIDVLRRNHRSFCENRLVEILKELEDLLQEQLNQVSKKIAQAMVFNLTILDVPPLPHAVIREAVDKFQRRLKMRFFKKYGIMDEHPLKLLSIFDVLNCGLEDLFKEYGKYIEEELRICKKRIYDVAQMKLNGIKQHACKSAVGWMLPRPGEYEEKDSIMKASCCYISEDEEKCDAWYLREQCTQEYRNRFDRYKNAVENVLYQANMEAAEKRDFFGKKRDEIQHDLDLLKRYSMSFKR